MKAGPGNEGCFNVEDTGAPLLKGRKEIKVYPREKELTQNVERKRDIFSSGMRS